MVVSSSLVLLLMMLCMMQLLVVSRFFMLRGRYKAGRRGGGYMVEVVRVIVGWELVMLESTPAMSLKRGGSPVYAFFSVTSSTHRPHDAAQS